MTSLVPRIGPVCDTKLESHTWDPFVVSRHRPPYWKALLMTPLLAYLDPGSSSMLLQLLVGGSAGLAVFGRHLWSVVRERISVRKASAE